MPPPKTKLNGKPSNAGRNQYSSGARTTMKRGPRRSRNILVSTISGPAAACFPLDTTIHGLYRNPITQSLGLRLRALTTKVSERPVALVLVGKHDDKERRSKGTIDDGDVGNESAAGGTVSTTTATTTNTAAGGAGGAAPSADAVAAAAAAAAWKSLDEVLGWEVRSLNDVLITPPTIARFVEILRDIPMEEEIRMGMTHRTSDVVDIMYKSRYKRRRIVQREVSWEVPREYIATSIGRRTKAKNGKAPRKKKKKKRKNKDSSIPLFVCCFLR